MTLLGIWLCVVGLVDLLRAVADAVSVRRRALLAGFGTALLILAALLVEPSAAPTFVVFLGWVGCYLLWLFGSSAALDGSGTAARAIAFVGLGAGTLFGLLLDDPQIGRRVPGILEQVEPSLVLVIVGVTLVQLSTANIAVRLVLDAVGVPASTNEKQLKGGRLLGPMERLFIVLLGLLGQPTAAAIVVAAKGLLRFPELQRGAKTGPSDITEYFLIGSFASWLFAVAGVGLVLLAQL